MKYFVRERQLSKMRIEISAYEDDVEFGVNCCDTESKGESSQVPRRRKLGHMFGAIERSKERLNIQDYSISQTSLEQIFNQFASQQDEEKGIVI